MKYVIPNAVRNLQKILRRCRSSEWQYNNFSFSSNSRYLCSRGYEAIQSFLGPLRAGFWQGIAWMFGASLKKGYRPEGVDKLTERVVLMVEAGQL